VRSRREAPCLRSKRGFLWQVHEGGATFRFNFAEVYWNSRLQVRCHLGVCLLPLVTCLLSLAHESQGRNCCELGCRASDGAHPHVFLLQADGGHL
jgi:hypothetical protein